MILLQILLFIILASICYEIDDEFTHENFYESFSKSKECFKIHHNNPTGPLFLLAHIEYEYTSKETQKIAKKVFKKYQLKLIKEPCKSFQKIPIVGKGYSKMHFEYQFYLYYIENTTAISFYDFYPGFKSDPLIIVSTNNNFGLRVEFSHTADENSLDYDPDLPEVKSYLRSLTRKDDSICVITENNDKVILWRENLSEMKGLITRIRVENIIKNGSVILEKDYPAFECNQYDTSSLQTVYLIYEGKNVDILISYIYWKIEKTNAISYLINTEFYNVDIVNINEQKKLPKKAKKIFSLNLHATFVECPNDDIITLLTSSLGYAYAAKLVKKVELSKGVQRIKLYNPLTISPCIW